MPEQPLLNDMTFIPNLIDEVLGEDLFFEVAQSIELGPWNGTQGGYNRLGCLTPREEAFWSLARIIEELRQYWMSPTANRAAQWLTQPEALDSLLEVVDEADYLQLAGRVRLAQRLAASALTEHMAIEGLAISPRIHLDCRALCRYLRSDAAVSDYLDLTYSLQEVSVETESAQALAFCVTHLRPLWASLPVARTLQWLTHSENILGALIASDYYLDADTPERVSLVCHVVATVVERIEY